MSTDSKVTMNRIMGDVQNFYKVRHKPSGKWVMGRPPHDLTNNSVDGAMYDAPTSVKRSWSQRSSYGILKDLKFEDLEIIKFELVELGVVEL